VPVSCHPRMLGMFLLKTVIFIFHLFLLTTSLLRKI
jgi:hypothetical protein